MPHFGPMSPIFPSPPHLSSFVACLDYIQDHLIRWQKLTAMCSTHLLLQKGYCQGLIVLVLPQVWHGISEVSSCVEHWIVSKPDWLQMFQRKTNECVFLGLISRWRLLVIRTALGLPHTSVQKLMTDSLSFPLTLKCPFFESLVLHPFSSGASSAHPGADT